MIISQKCVRIPYRCVKLWFTNLFCVRYLKTQKGSAGYEAQKVEIICPISYTCGGIRVGDQRTLVPIPMFFSQLSPSVI